MKGAPIVQRGTLLRVKKVGKRERVGITRGMVGKLVTFDDRRACIDCGSGLVAWFRWEHVEVAS